jgi:hypothetical protein
MVTRDEILDIAKTLISGDRHDDYGNAKDSFESIARLWTAYLNVAVSPMDVGNMMMLLKMSRSLTSPDKSDTWVDICGYSALTGEMMSDGKK